MSSDADPADPVGSTAGSRTVPLGEVRPARSRHAGRRSTVAVAGDTAVAGTADGTVCGFDLGDGTERWREKSGEAGLVSAAAVKGGVVVGERGPDGEVRFHRADSGAVGWRYRTADDVGDPQKDTRFFLPFVADLASEGGRVYAAARRYERGPDGDRTFESVVYAFDPRGDAVWTYRTDASPIAIDADGGRVAVAYNRCPGSHQRGLVVLDAADGSERWHWDPGNDGQRRVGDVSLLGSGMAVASHGDYRGYVLGSGGDVRWKADLATPTDIGEETVYAYPNHVRATEAGVVFVTGNTYPEEGRQTDHHHPEDHTVFGYTTEGKRSWTCSAGGFVTGVGHDGDRLVVPGAQNFRERDAAVHGYGLVDVADGHLRSVDTEGIAVAGALAGDRVAVVEEPVEYHDEGVVHGAYRLHLAGV